MLEEVTKKYDYFISQQNEKMRETFDKAVRDSLTGLYNREYLDEYSKQAFGRVARSESSLVLIFIDLDNFKQVNDNFGHNEGDRVLVEVSNIFKKSFRLYDIVVRYGGDEFIVLIEDKEHDTEALEMILQLLVTKIEKNLKTFGISASYGYAIAPAEAQDLASLIELADKRMYAQKQAKKAMR